VLYATAGVALTMLFVQGILGTNAAVLAGLTLTGSYQYVTQGRLGRVDMALSFFEALALFSFYWWIRRDRTGQSRSRSRAMQFVCAAALALGVLAKGPVGAILPLAAMGIFVLAEKVIGSRTYWCG
jgi:4-amino-4-deoxy-L-arabinose transferase-like glycosyltransferase